MLNATLVCEAHLALFMYIVFANAIADTLYFIYQLYVEPFALLSASTHRLLNGFPLLPLCYQPVKKRPKALRKSLTSLTRL